jgi:hypothetical protein
MTKFGVLLLALTSSLFSVEVNHSLKIDEIISNDLKNKKIEMPVKASDEVFVRRAYLDIVGRIPTFEESQSFVKNPNKEELINKLINSQGYVESTFNFYADLLRVKKKILNNVTGETYIAWIKEQIKNNTPYDQFVKSILTAEGTIFTNPAVGYFLRDEGMLLDNVSNTFQAFAGMNISCAQCHDHPFDDWTQMDYYEMTAFFTTVNTRGIQENNKYYNQELRKQSEELDRSGKQKGAINRIGQFWQVGGYRNTVNSDLKKVLTLPHDYKYRDGEPGEVIIGKTAVGDRVKERRKREGLRQSFTDWIISDNHPTFAANIVNRLWFKSFGFKLIDDLNNIAEFDELRKSKNDRLMEYLVKLMKDLDYDTKEFNKILYNTNFYASVADGEDQFIGPKTRRMTSAQLWDSIVTLYTGDVDKWQPKDRREEFVNMFPDPKTLNAEEALKIYAEYQKMERSYYEGAPQVDRLMMIRSSNIFEGRGANFMLEFGRSDRELIETGDEDANITQILTLMNGKVTKELMSDNSHIAKKLVNFNRDRAVDYLFKSYIGRSPTDGEKEVFKEAEFSDIVWVLINSHEFKLIV